MKKLILFDLDNTLLDSAGFRKSIYPKIVDILHKNEKSHTADDIEKIISESIEKFGLFDPDKLVDEIAANLSAEDKDAMKNLFYDSEGIKLFFYKEVMEEIGKFAQLGEVGVLTQGFTKFQTAKFASIASHFHEEHIYIAEDKRAKMNSIFNKYKDYKVYYIDDLLMMLKHAKEVRRDVVTILMKRPNLKPQEETFKPDIEVFNLTEAFNFIKNS